MLGREESPLIGITTNLAGGINVEEEKKTPKQNNQTTQKQTKQKNKIHSKIQ